MKLIEKKKTKNGLSLMHNIIKHFFFTPKTIFGA